MEPEWINCYDAGIFTEFQEQRAPGHTVLGKKIYQKGMLDIIEDINCQLDQLDFFNDPVALDKREELKAMEITARAIIRFANVMRNIWINWQHRKEMKPGKRNYMKWPTYVGTFQPIDRRRSMKHCNTIGLYTWA